MVHPILCVDDEEHNLQTFERLLRKSYKVYTASSGDEAIKLLNKIKFPLIISDQRMPGMTGVELFIEAQKIQPKAIRILLTGYTDLESVIAAINEGRIYRYITKPWNNEQLLTTISQAIEVFEMKETIEQQNKELIKANKELQSLSQLKTDFMLLVNHELKTPLTAIFSFVQLLGEEKLNPEQKLYLSKIEKNTNRLQELINDTLLITKMKSNKENLVKTNIDIKAMVESHWESAKNLTKNKSLRLVLLSASQFTQTTHKEYTGILLEKIISNSFEHTSPDSDVTIELIENSEHWELKTKNKTQNTISKSPEELFNAFSKDGNILNHTAGTGLGLAVIQSITQLFSGEVKININENNFELHLTFPKKT